LVNKSKFWLRKGGNNLTIQYNLLADILATFIVIKKGESNIAVNNNDVTTQLETVLLKNFIY